MATREKNLSNLSFGRLLLAVFLLSLAVRLSIGLWHGYDFNSDYAAIARNILHLKIYSIDGATPTATRTPGYPLILAGVMALFNENPLPIIILFSIVGAVNACLCALIAKKLFNPLTGFIAGIIYAVTPYLAQKEIATENGMVALGLLTGLYIFLKARENKNFFLVTLAAIPLGFTYLVRPSTGLIPFFLAFCLIIDNTGMINIRQRFNSAAIIILVFIIMILPWGIRNKNTFGKWYFGQTNLWYNFYIGNHERTFDIYPEYSLDNLSARINLHLPRGNELEHEEWFRVQAMGKIAKSGPKIFIANCLRKFGLLWNARLVPYTKRIGNDPVTGRSLDTKRGIFDNLAFSVPYIFILLLTAFGCWQERRRKKLLLFFFGFIICFSLPYMLTIAYSRYTTAAYFILILLAARALSSFCKYNLTC